MNKNSLIFVFSLSLCACGGVHEHGEEAEHHDEPQGVVALHDEMAQRFGVKVDTVQLSSISSSIKCGGVIERSASGVSTIVAPQSGLVKLAPGITVGATVGSGSFVAGVTAGVVSGGDTERAAHAAVVAAREELARLKPLYEKKLITASEYAAAELALEQALAAHNHSASAGRAVAPSAGAIGEILVADGSYVTAGQPIATIVADSGLTLRARVPAADYPQLAAVEDAVIVSGDKAYRLSEMGGKRGAVTSESGYGVVTFSFRNDGSFLPGTSVRVYLLDAEKAGVVTLPVGAIVEQQGEYYVYRRVMDEHYIKEAVKLGASDGKRVEITSGVTPGDEIVSRGAITLRLAESSGAIPEGHNHHH